MDFIHRPHITSRVWVLHALYFILGGVWSIVGRASFEAISGRKTDYWLVRTVGALLVVVGGVIAAAGTARRLTPEISWLAIGSSLALALVDIIYVAKRRISKVYLLDSIANLLLIRLWIARRRAAH